MTLAPATGRVAYVEAHTNMCLNQVDDLVKRIRRHRVAGKVSADVAIALFAAAFDEQVPRLLELQAFDAAEGDRSPSWAPFGRRRVARASRRAS